MSEIELERLEDFKKVLTYQLVTKIKYNFKGNYQLYYQAPIIWDKWKNHEINYDKKIYKLIVMFNNTALSKHQCMHIFGKVDGKYLPYSELIASDTTIKMFNKGTVCMNGIRYGIKKRYQLPFEFIQSIFENEQLLSKIIDAGSDYYTDRQRRLIFTQINKQNNYHYKTKQEIVEDITEQERIEAVLADFD